MACDPPVGELDNHVRAKGGGGGRGVEEGLGGLKGLEEVRGE